MGNSTQTLLAQPTGGQMSSVPPRRQWSRVIAIATLALGVAFLSLLFALSRPQHDFLEYWTASHLLLSHRNPYSLAEVFITQKALGWNESVPLMFVCPPWALPIIAPLGLARSYLLAWFAWMLVLVACSALSSRLLMDVYFADLRIPEISDTPFYRCLFVFTFYPLLLCLRFAQTAPFLLLGLAGFLYFMRGRRLFLAGAALALTAIKPQLLFLVWIAVFLDSIRSRRWTLLLGSVSMIGLCLVIGLALDPNAIQQYRDLVRTPYLSINPSGITAMIRRALKARDTYWMQFVPPFFGVAWLAWYWRRHQAHWEWQDRMPMLVTISVLTSAYGWVFDQTVLAVAVIAIAAKHARPVGRIPWNLVVWYTGLNAALMLLLAMPPLTYIPAPILIAFLLTRDTQEFSAVQCQ